MKKKEIQNLNSATIANDLLQTSKYNRGLRVGIIGEFYVNFGFWGIFLMYFIGVLVKYLYVRMLTLPMLDIRFVFSIIFFSILVYALIGQINAISSSIANFVFILIFILIIAKRKKLLVNSD